RARRQRHAAAGCGVGCARRSSGVAAAGRPDDTHVTDVAARATVAGVWRAIGGTRDTCGVSADAGRASAGTAGTSGAAARAFGAAHARTTTGAGPWAHPCPGAGAAAATDARASGAWCRPGATRLSCSDAVARAGTDR